MQSQRPRQNHPKFFKNSAILNADTAIDLPNFISKLNKKLLAQPFEILNSPTSLYTIAGVKRAQKEINIQMDIMNKHGRMFGTTAGLMYVTETLRALTVKEIRQYYDEYIKTILARKNGTCDGLCILVFHFAQELLAEHSITQITVDICALRNWSHSLIRLVHTPNDGPTETIFYDHWSQRCFENHPDEAKLYSAEDFNTELQNLMSKAPMTIQRTKHFYDLESNKQVENSDTDFSYFVACSTGDFTTPAKSIDAPTVASNRCVIS